MGRRKSCKRQEPGECRIAQLRADVEHLDTEIVLQTPRYSGKERRKGGRETV